MAARFRLKAPVALESECQAQIIDFLRAEQLRGRVIWFCRVNGGGVKTATQFIRFYALYLLGIEKRSRGYPDLHGMLPGGRYFALEVKRRGERETVEQREFIDAVLAGGGIAGVVYGYEDARELLEGGRDA